MTSNTTRPNRLFALQNNPWRLLLMMVLVLVAILIALRVLFGFEIALAALRYFLAAAVATLLAVPLSKRLDMLAQLAGLAATTTVSFGLIWLTSFEIDNLIPGTTWITSGVQTVIDWLDEVFGMQWHAQSSVYQTRDFQFYEWLNTAFLLVFPLGCLGFGWAFQQWLRRSEETSSPEPSDGRTLAMVNNATFATAAGWIGILFSLGFFVLLTWAHTNPDFRADTYLEALPWFVIIAPVLCLAVAVQRQLPVPPMPETAEYRIVRETVSVKPLYELLQQALQPHVGWAHWSDATPHDETANVAVADKQRLKDSGIVYKYGNPDLAFLRLMSETMTEVEDSGNATLILCPDGSGKQIFDRLRAQIPFDFNKLVRNLVLWQSEAKDAYANRILDVVICEESEFVGPFLREIAKKSDHAYLANLTRRLRLLVTIDFHTIDVSKVILMLSRWDVTLADNAVGLLVQSHERENIADQMIALRTALGPRGAAGPTPMPMQTLVPGAAIGKLWLLDSENLRRELIELFGAKPKNTAIGLSSITDATPVYFRLMPKMLGDTVRGLPVFVQIPAGDGDPFVWLRNDLTAQPGFETISDHSAHSDAARNQMGICYLPSNGLRVTVVSDHGNAFDSLVSDCAFAGGPDDHLMVVVGDGYPGRSYLRAALATNLRRDLLAPIAQAPGVGIAEVANSLAAGLANQTGLAEDAVEQMLNRLSGGVRQRSGVSATKRGLQRLFQIVSDQELPSINSRLDRAQRTVFQQEWASANPILVEPMANVVDTIGHPIGQIPMADNGLLFSEGEHLILNNKRYKIDSINPRTMVFRESAQSNISIKHNYYQRIYEFLDGTGLNAEGNDLKTLEFFAETGLTSVAHSQVVRKIHLHIGIKRFSSAVWSCEADIEPSVRDGRGVQDFTARIPQIRPFRSVTLLAFEDAAGEFLTDGVLRATLAASLQVVLGLAFPDLRRRIAAIDLGHRNDKNRDAKTFELLAPDVVKSYPVFRCLFPLGLLNGHEVPAFLAALGGPPDLPQHLCFAVIEDAPHDIGVARRVHDRAELVLRRWKHFLDWAAGEQNWNIAGLLDAQAAARFRGLQGHD